MGNSKNEHLSNFAILLKFDAYEIYMIYSTSVSFSNVSDFILGTAWNFYVLISHFPIYPQTVISSEQLISIILPVNRLILTCMITDWPFCKLTTFMNYFNDNQHIGHTPSENCLYLTAMEIVLHSAA